MRHPWLVSSILGLVASAALFAGGEAQGNLLKEAAMARSKKISKIHYDLNLDFDLGAKRKEEYTGKVIVSFHLTGDPSGLFLDFNGKLSSGKPVRSLAVNGKTVSKIRHEAGQLHLPAKLLQKGPNTVKVEYTCNYDNDGAGLHKIEDPADGRTYLYTHFEPFDANRMFPCFDQPDLKARYTLEVDARDDWTVVSGGALEAKKPGNVFRFRQTETYSPYIFALVAGPFRVWEDKKARIPSHLLVTESMAKYADPEEIFEVTRQGFDFFEKYFEVDYPFGKYDQIFVPQFNWGAMENVGCVIFNDRMIFRKKATELDRERRANTILHEMAHMWFGDIVTMKWWNDLWLNESFATYMAHLGLTKATRFKGAWETFASRIKGWAYWQDQLPTTHPIETAVPDTKTTFTNFDGITYGKGASVLKQLAFFVGEDAFQKGVANYLKKHQFGNATRADFIRSIGKAANEDLTEWTKLWLQSSGTNTITPKIKTRDGKIKSFVLEQSKGNGASVFRPHRLKVGLYDRKGKKLVLREAKTVRVEGKYTRVKAYEGKAAPDFVFANYGDHAFAKTFLDPISLEYAKKELESLPDSMLRAAVWQTAWFMVRDLATLPTEYLDLFLAKASTEKDPKVLSGILGNVRTALNRYLPTRKKYAYSDKVRKLAWSQARKVKAGSDLQKAWFDMGAALTSNKVHARYVSNLLTGKAKIKGVTLDQPTRWNLLARLCSVNYRGSQKMLDEEKQRDKSQKGAAAAFRAEASFPDKAHKEAAWKRFVGDTKTPLDHLREGMRGFWWPHQSRLLKPYAKRFYGALEGIASKRGGYYVEAFVENLFPSVIITKANQKAAAALIRANDPALSSVLRSVKESNSELERALAIRASFKKKN
ncbi:MAG: aminopeptidase N [Bdellovibrionales bacterium]